MCLLIRHDTINGNKQTSINDVIGHANNAHFTQDELQYISEICIESYGYEWQDSECFPGWREAIDDGGHQAEQNEVDDGQLW